MTDLKFIDKPFWYRDLRTFQALVASQSDQGQVLCEWLDTFGWTKTEIDTRFQRFWARMLDIDAEFEDLLAVFCLELMQHRFTPSEWTQANYDATIGEVVKAMIEVALRTTAPLIGGKQPASDQQTIRIPISGTLKKPVLDPRAMEQLVAQVLKNGTRNLIRNGLDDIENLVRPGK